MAARRKNAQKSSPQGGGKKAKGAKPKKAKAAKAAKVAKEVSPGPPLEVVMSIVTGIMILAAVIMVDYARGQRFGTGVLAPDAYVAPVAATE